MAKAIVKQVPLAPIVKNAVKQMVEAADVHLDPKEVEETVEVAVRDAVKVQ
jgi:hypothetical protein